MATQQKQSAPVAPATEQEAAQQSGPTAQGERRKDTQTVVVNTERIRAARTALVELLGPVARTRDNAARLAAEAREQYQAVSPVEIARHTAIIALELFAAFPKAAKEPRTWAGLWSAQMNLLASETFDGVSNEEAAKLRNRFGQDMSRFSLVYFYLPDSMEPWSEGRYGVQPKSYANLSTAYAIARNLKASRNERSEVQLRKLYQGVRKRFGSLSEFARFLKIAESEYKVESEASVEQEAPQIKTA